MLARYEELCQAEQKATAEFREYIRLRYEAKKQALEQDSPSVWVKKEFSDIRFTDISMEDNPEQQFLYVEASFDGKYYEERIMGLLEALAPWTVDGIFSFCGEDEAHWRLYFTGVEWSEQRGDVIYRDLNAVAEHNEAPLPGLVEDVGTFEALLTEVESRLKSDNRPAPQRGRQLMTAFQNQDPDGVLLALTGWSLRSLGALAGIWQNAEGT